MKRNAFTLLELIVVIIIIGVMAGLALPKLFSAIEFSRSAEAISMLTSWRSSIERCALWEDGDYVSCAGRAFEAMDIDNPFDAPGSHFALGRVDARQGFGYYGFMISSVRVEPGTNNPVSGDPGAAQGMIGCGSCLLFIPREANKSSVALSYCHHDNFGSCIEISGTGFYEAL